MHLDFVHNDWVCDFHSTHNYCNEIITDNTVIDCTCSDEKYIITWNYRNSPDKSYKSLEEDKNIKINIRKQEWLCSNKHSYELDRAVLRSHDTLICTECSEQYQFEPEVSIPEYLYCV